jgi:hypothetical protein
MGYPAKDLKNFLKDNKWYTKLQLLIQRLKLLLM